MAADWLYYAICGCGEIPPKKAGHISGNPHFGQSSAKDLKFLFETKMQTVIKLTEQMSSLQKSHLEVEMVLSTKYLTHRPSLYKDIYFL